MIGAPLRHYRLEAKLAGEGLGLLYRARDTHLNRAVVVKVLPATPDVTTQQRARFAQAAKAASAVNHPNVITVYETGNAEVDGQPVDFIAMEYFRAKTLDKLIGRKGLGISDALHYAVQIANGLAAVQGAGIVHFNLKPENILVNKVGEVKILDLGLMEPTSERSNIFSFGATVYEMITGERVCDSSSPISVEGVPRQLGRIVTRCLDQDPQRRWQRMADIKIALEDMSQDLDSSKEASGSWVSRRSFPLYFGLPLVLIALGAGGYVGARVLTPPQPSFQRLTYRRGDVSGARFSPDGRTVLFSAQWATDPTRIFSVQPNRSESSPLNLPGGRILSISSSGEMAVLLGSPTSGAPGTLARVSLSGGAPREILENVIEADWSPDGVNLAISHAVGGRNRIEYPIGTVLDESDGRPSYNLRVSPKGDLLACFQYDNAVGDFAVAVLDRHGMKRVVSRGWAAIGGLAWSPRSDEIWYVGTKTGGEPVLRAVKTDGDDRTVLDAPAWLGLKDISRDGRMLATVADSRVGVLGLAPGAKQERDLSWFDASRIYDISNDGKTIVFVEMSYGKPRNTAIYVRETDGSPAVRLGDGNRPALSPDGKWVACIVSDGPRTALTLLPTGAGETRTIGMTGMHYERVEWFPDGHRVLFQGSEPNRPARTFVQHINGGEPVVLTPEGMDASHVSPDQKYATVVVAGRLSLFPISGGDPKPIANLEPGESVIRWSADGRFLFLRKQVEPAVLKISRLEVASGRTEVWKEVKAPDSVGVQIGPIVMTPDGNSYAYSFQRDISTLYLAEGLR